MAHLLIIDILFCARIMCVVYFLLKSHAVRTWWFCSNV